MIDERTIPIAKPDLDLVALSPSAEQYFLFSRVDGKLTVADLCRTSGLGRDKTLEVLASLAQAGAITIDGFDPSPSKPQPASSPAAARSDAEAPAEEPADPAGIQPNYPIPLAKFEFDEALLSCDAPIDDGLRREMLCLHAQLNEMSFYDYFGLKSSASRKEIKKSYFKLSKSYHPDRFFRKDLGPLAPIQEEVFKELTRAYKTLSRRGAREKYDQELSARRATFERSQRPASSLSEVSIPEVADENKRKAVGALLMRRAEKLMEQQEFKRATAEYQKALALTRDAQAAMRVASRLLNQAQLSEEAASFARAAIKLGADRPAAHFLIGQALEQQGAQKAAIAEYRRALAIMPDHAESLERLTQLDALL